MHHVTDPNPEIGVKWAVLRCCSHGGPEADVELSLVADLEDPVQATSGFHM